MLESSRLIAGLQIYEYGDVPPDAVGVPPIVIQLPLQIESFIPASAIGNGLTVIKILSVAVQPKLSLTVTK